MNSWTGLIIVVAAGILNGSYALPMKKTPRWSFENTWLVYSVVAMLLLSWGIAFATVPQLGTVYARAGTGPVLMIFAFGLIWGLANLLFGAGLSLIGMSLTFPICIGLSTALGAIIPMAQKPGVFLTPAGATTTVGIIVLLVGVALCGLAGIRMDAQAKSASDTSTAVAANRKNLVKGLAIVVLAGLFDPFLNFAFTFGAPVKTAAIAAGAAAGTESDAIWALALSGSFVVNVIYCGKLLTDNQTWGKFRESGTAAYWLLAAVMGIIWMFSITLYGRGASKMGVLGDSAGWAIFYCSIIIFSTFWGIVCGEWREGQGPPLRTLYVGLAVLMVAIVVLGYGNSLATVSPQLDSTAGIQ